MIEKHAIMKEILQSIGLVVFIAIVGDKSDKGEEIVRTIWVFLHLPVHLSMSLLLRSSMIKVIPYLQYQGEEYQEVLWQPDAS